MESITRDGFGYAVDGVFGGDQELRDERKRKGKRYSLVLIQMIMLRAKTCGENHAGGIAAWAEHRDELLVDWFKLKRKPMPYPMTDQRTLADRVNVEELVRVGSEHLIGKEYSGKQVSVVIDGKALRGTPDDNRVGPACWQPTCQKKGPYWSWPWPGISERFRRLRAC